MRIDISELGERFPDFQVAVVLCDGLTIEEARPEELHEIIAEREEAARLRWAGYEMTDIPGIKVWRDAYKEFGIKRTSYRSSVERLLKNCMSERAMPGVNSFVDLYNAVSLSHVMPLGADDLSLLVGNVSYRYAREGDTFHDMANDGGVDPENDPPKDGEVVLADDEKLLCRRWNWRQDARSLISTDTDRAIIVVEDNGCGGLEDAVDDLIDLVGYFCGGRSAVTTAKAAEPTLDLRWP